ncbi:MAG TPA: hypothetical protein VFO19_12510 [Vicinamibacterales bacterium]|nr:hypothetical protein [Vicinamibacterales bacterium]
MIQPGRWWVMTTVAIGDIHGNRRALDDLRLKLQPGAEAPEHPRRATVGIDTISHGVLTALCWPDRAVFQSARFV